jgi:hypothetical protein
MTTCEPLPDGGEDDEPLTLFAVDSLASPSASPGSASRRRIAGGSGQRSRASFAIYDPATSSWRTCQVSLAGEWETYSETWPASGMTRNGTAYQRPSSVPPIYETESGSWPTPSARDWRSGKAGPETMARNSRPLNEVVTEREMWPTPTRSDGYHGGRGDLLAMVRTGSVSRRDRWPTPTANRWDGLQSHGVNAVSGQLNPTWVEWLMGYPPGWTDCGD